MIEKPPEFYVGVIAAMGFVYQRLPHLTHLSRAAYAGISGGLGYAAAPAVAALTGQSEVLTVIVITALGYIVLDTGASVLSDKGLWKGAVKGRINGGANDKDA
jgi:ABC-type uncharacterized transport system permease subunit